MGQDLEEILFYCECQRSQKVMVLRDNSRLKHFQTYGDASISMWKKTSQRIGQDWVISENILCKLAIAKTLQSTGNFYSGQKSHYQLPSK